MPQGKYLPEGFLLKEQAKTLTERTVEEAYASGRWLEGIATMCNEKRELFVRFGGQKGIIPYEETCIGANSGKVRDIAIMSKVGKPICFRIIGRREDGLWILSRRILQQEAHAFFMKNLYPGEVLCGVITHVEQFGAFVDIGCGVISMIGIENITVSRIRSAKERFYIGQKVYAVVMRTEPPTGRIYLTHKELLGTWEENTALIRNGIAIEGIVRSVESYGIFVEIAPNLSGLAEMERETEIGMNVTVLVKAILPERMKVKLQILEKRPGNGRRLILPDDYFIREGRLLRWQYQPDLCGKHCIETDFT